MFLGINNVAELLGISRKKVLATIKNSPIEFRNYNDDGYMRQGLYPSDIVKYFEVRHLVNISGLETIKHGGYCKFVKRYMRQELIRYLDGYKLICSQIIISRSDALINSEDVEEINDYISEHVVESLGYYYTIPQAADILYVHSAFLYRLRDIGFSFIKKIILDRGNKAEVIKEGFVIGDEGIEYIKNNTRDKFGHSHLKHYIPSSIEKRDKLLSKHKGDQMRAKDVARILDVQLQIIKYWIKKGWVQAMQKYNRKEYMLNTQDVRRIFNRMMDNPNILDVPYWLGLNDV